MSSIVPAQQVLVVGAGPAGLFAAAELARHGVRARLVEREPAPHREARATAIQPAMLELLDRAGVLDRFLEAGVPIRGVRFLGPGLEEIAAGRFAGIDCPHEHQCSLPQWRTEAILTDHLEQLGGRVERGVEAIGIEEVADGLKVELRHASGEVEHVAVDYVLGAGGAHSITRSSMHSLLDGATYGGRFIAADARSSLPSRPEEAMIHFGPVGFVLMAPLPDERWILFVNADGSTDTAPSERELAALVDRRVGRDAGIHDVTWTACFRMHHRIVPRLADGRRFLLGDAGHLSSPFAGEGLNTALMDAADLAWKLALVLRGAAKPALLDSFAIERGFADRHVLEVSDQVHGTVMGLVEAYAAGKKPEFPAPDAARDLAFQRSRSMLDVSYAGSPLVGEHVAKDYCPAPAPGSRFPERSRLSGTGHHVLGFGDADLRRLRARWSGLVEVMDGTRSGFDATRAGVPEVGAVLVRPDGMIGFRASPADEPGLDALDAHLASYLVSNHSVAAASASSLSPTASIG
jgi:2-polyprenyl-6-methoxyphenol hydroxylase-like FAD-dependent oxidoreductase